MGALDGKKILRFLHAYETGGGIERYVADLDAALLRENSATIVHLYMARSGESTESRTIESGRGQVIKTPLAVEFLKPSPSGASSHASATRSTVRLREFTNRLAHSAALYPLVRRFVIRTGRLYRHDTIAFSKLNEGLDKYLEGGVTDLLVLHYAGGRDSAEVIQRAAIGGIPCIYINHFANDRFYSFSLREQINHVRVVGGVTGVDVPRYLRKKFVNFSDGIDTDFFRPDNSDAEGVAQDEGLVLLPARITRTKGHVDLIEATSLLVKEGVSVRLAFAGRIDSHEFDLEIRALLRERGLVDHVCFEGELTPTGLRDLYSRCSFVAFPTYHHEGLPRILLEAQAMKRPVIAYNSGGLSDGLVDGVTGHLVRKGDVGTFSSRMRDFLVDPRRCAEMGEQGRKLVEERFSLRALADAHERHYHSAITEKRRRPGSRL